VADVLELDMGDYTRMGGRARSAWDQYLEDRGVDLSEHGVYRFCIDLRTRVLTAFAYAKDAAGNHFTVIENGEREVARAAPFHVPLSGG